MGRLVWDTFPKSGSAWLARTLELAYPTHEVIWGGHRRSTLRQEANVITSIRSPKDCVPSYILFFGDKSADYLLEWYCRFMAATIECADRIFVTDFEQITTRPELVMKAYAARFRLTEPKLVTLETIKAKVLETHPDHLPKPITDDRVKANKLVLLSPSLPAALELYKQARALSSMV